MDQWKLKVDSTSEDRRQPPGRVKLANALRQLLKDREFDAVTTAEIARTAGVNEALIYRYFGDKRGLLHEISSEYLKDYISQIERELGGIKGALSRLRRLIWCHMHLFESNVVFAKLILLEVRSFPGYFAGPCYQQVKRYTSILMGILKEGVKEGAIRKNVPLDSLRQIVLGGIEHLCLPDVIFNRALSVDKYTDDLCDIVFNGISTRKAMKGKRG